jgi:uncharacterized protein
VLVLLPPSEGKAAPARGRPVDLAGLAFPELTERRDALLDALGGDLRSAPSAPATSVYTGVLYQRLGLPDLPARAQRRVLIASGLWGMLRPRDRIPAYKLPIGSRLPGFGGLAAWWRPALREVLPDRAGELVLDLRSGPYVAAWRPQAAVRLEVRGFTETAGGSRKVISHMAKRVRGDVARAVLEAGAGAATPDDVAAVAEAAGMRVELSPGPALDVIERA